MDLDKKRHKENLEKGDEKYSLKKKINCHNRRTYWPSSIVDKIQWFCFQDVMTHAANNTKEHPEQNILESVLTVFSMFMIKNDYDHNVNMVDFYIKCINCQK